ncbi:hypothetical protein [Hyphomonas sp. GM-8P]|uniref:hypothetical protein n=1 Tax=Hyphomonas sp. GM-8P TaxID=1280945 RepID=UPI0011BEF49D|nr:hypothetical protein [Hyphomonas sp. GM-8P]|tara:strand:- start:7152 stop:8015 length:864 start_codon:yes stop_codon:yes gene_type:complete
MAEDQLETWIRQTAEKWAGLTEMSEPEPPSSSPDWSSLAMVPNQELANWARLLLKELYEVTDAAYRKQGANRARQGFAEIEAILGTLGAMLFHAQRFVSGGEPYEWLSRLWAIVGKAETAARGAAQTGTAPSIGLYGRSVSAKAGSFEYMTLKRYAVGTMKLFEAAGDSQRAAARKVAAILVRHGIKGAGEDAIRTPWRKLVEEDEQQYFGMSAADALLLGWIGREPLESWRTEKAACDNIGKPVPQFASWACAQRHDLLKSFLPRLLGEQAANWLEECESWGKDTP